MSLAKKVVNEMIVNDEFSKWLGIKVLVVDEGHCVLQMKVRKEMTNFIKKHKNKSHERKQKTI